MKIIKIDVDFIKTGRSIISQNDERAYFKTTPKSDNDLTLIDMYKLNQVIGI